MARILLIEDDVLQTALIVRWLHDHELVVCTDTTSAQSALRDGMFDLVVSDISLPSGNGLDLLAERGPGSTPTLLITASADLETAVRALDLGAVGLLPKPFDRRQLQSKVEAALARRPKGRVVLAIGAHPDDAEIGVGGVLAAHHQAGDHVVVLTLSRGAAGGNQARRVREAELAASRLGAEAVVGDLPDTEMRVGPELIGRIEREVRRLAPDVVYTHSAHDRHQDHRAVHEATRIAARSVPSLFCYESPSCTIAFAPSRFVDVSGTLERKLAVLEAFVTQAGRRYLDPELIRSTARYWGRFATYDFVEPLEVVRDAVRC